MYQIQNISKGNKCILPTLALPEDMIYKWFLFQYNIYIAGNPFVIMSGITEPRRVTKYVAIQTQPGPSSLLEERSKTPIFFVAFFVLLATPQIGGNGQDI